MRIEKMSNNPSTSQIVKQLKLRESDFEYYPTHTISVQSIYKDAKALLTSNSNVKHGINILDCGAGRGDFFEKFEKCCKQDQEKSGLKISTKFAIERSQALIENWPADIICIGTDFNEQTLIDKTHLPITFSNPPYSEWLSWTLKILQESQSRLIYLVLPSSKFNNSDQVQSMLDKRNATATIIDTFDFADGERRARVKADVIRVDMWPPSKVRGTRDAFEAGVDAFDIWFEEFVPVANNSKVREDFQKRAEARASTQTKVANELVAGRDLVDVLEELYQAEMQELIANYQKIGELDASLLKELDINVENVRTALKHKIVATKDLYWTELFNHLDQITSRLTTKSRENMLKHLQAKTTIDFTSSNVRALLIWVIKKSSLYFDSNLIDFFERNIEAANLVSYKSNQRTFKKEKWRYLRNEYETGDISHFSLDYRIVLQWIGTVKKDFFSSGADSRHELEPKAAMFFNDLITVANNLGYQCDSRADKIHWDYGQKYDFYATDPKGEEVLLFDIKFFKNRNCHIRYNQRFIQILNIEFGRLKGWIKEKSDVQNELDIPTDVVEEAWGSNIQLGVQDVGTMIEFKQAS